MVLKALLGDRGRGITAPRMPLRAKDHLPKAGTASIKARARTMSFLFILSVWSVYLAQARPQRKGPGEGRNAEERLFEECVLAPVTGYESCWNGGAVSWLTPHAQRVVGYDRSGSR